MNTPDNSGNLLSSHDDLEGGRHAHDCNPSSLLALVILLYR